MNSEDLKNLIVTSLNGLKIDAALIGSRSPKDLDLFIVNNQSHGLSNYHDTVSFLSKLNELRQNLDCTIIVKHEHRRWVEEHRSLLHLLFYPSYAHLGVWELPSFMANVYEMGEFIIGNNKRLHETYKNYRSRRLESPLNIETFHILSYIDVAITNLIYLTIDSNIYSKSVYWENLQYVFRFTIGELFVSRLSPSSKIDFWGKQSLINYIATEFPEFLPVTKILSLAKKDLKGITKKQIRLLFIEYLKLCDGGLSIGGNLEIEQMLKMETEP